MIGGRGVQRGKDKRGWRRGLCWVGDECIKEKRKGVWRRGL